MANEQRKYEEEEPVMIRGLSSSPTLICDVKENEKLNVRQVPYECSLDRNEDEADGKAKAGTKVTCSVESTKIYNTNLQQNNTPTGVEQNLPTNEDLSALSTSKAKKIDDERNPVIENVPQTQPEPIIPVSGGTSVCPTSPRATKGSSNQPGSFSPIQTASKKSLDLFAEIQHLVNNCDKLEQTYQRKMETIGIQRNSIVTLNAEIQELGQEYHKVNFISRTKREDLLNEEKKKIQRLKAEGDTLIEVSTELKEHARKLVDKERQLVEEIEALKDSMNQTAMKEEGVKKVIQNAQKRLEELQLDQQAVSGKIEDIKEALKRSEDGKEKDDRTMKNIENAFEEIVEQSRLLRTRMNDLQQRMQIEPQMLE
jgi:hypothetical protein